MSTNNKTRAGANEKKVWRPIAASEASAPEGSKFPNHIHFIAVEELQGAWIDDVWEEADGGYSEETFEEYTDDNGVIRTKRIIKEIPRGTRYVLKYFNDDGQAKNALSSYNGPRAYKQ